MLVFLLRKKIRYNRILTCPQKKPSVKTNSLPLQYDQCLVIRELPCTKQLAGFLAERSSHRFRLPNILQSTSVTYLWNLHSLITVTRSYRNRTCFPFNQPIFNMKNILYFMYCSISRIKTAGTNYLLYETFNILAYPLPIYNNHFSLANHSKYGILIKYLQKHIWRRIEVVITGRTRNALALRGTRVRIPPSPLFQKETQFALYLCFLFSFHTFS